MKKIKSIRVNLLVLLLLPVFFVACKKDDGPIKKSVFDNLHDVPAITVSVDTSGSQSIAFDNLSAFQGKFKVAPYFTDPEAPTPQKVDIVARKTTNTGAVTIKIFKADVTTLPQDFTVTGADLESMFGQGSVALGDNYDFGVNIYTKDGSEFEAFPSIGIGTGTGPNGRPEYSQFARYGVICQYVPDTYQGNFKVLKDEWGDYAPGDQIEITKESDNSFSFKYAAPDALPIIVSVNTANNSTSVTKQVYTPDGYGFGYGAISVESVKGSPDNFVEPCTGVFSVKLTHTVSAGSFGSFVFSAQKIN